MPWHRRCAGIQRRSGCSNLALSANELARSQRHVGVEPVGEASQGGKQIRSRLEVLSIFRPQSGHASSTAAWSSRSPRRAARAASWTSTVARYRATGSAKGRGWNCSWPSNGKAYGFEFLVAHISGPSASPSPGFHSHPRTNRPAATRRPSCGPAESRTAKRCDCAHTGGHAVTASIVAAHHANPHTIWPAATRRPSCNPAKPRTAKRWIPTSPGAGPQVQCYSDKAQYFTRQWFRAMSRGSFR